MIAVDEFVPQSPVFWSHEFQVDIHGAGIEHRLIGRLSLRSSGNRGMGTPRQTGEEAARSTPSAEVSTAPPGSSFPLSPRRVLTS